MKRFKSYKIISLLSTLVFFGGVKIVSASWWNPIDWDAFQISIANLIIQAASKILWLAGIMFNYSMSYTLNFKTVIDNVGVVEIGWKIFRDLSNMMFIFILLAIAIATILGIQNYGAKQLLTKVILVALLMNFSLFTTKLVIDAANVFTVGFYNAITEETQVNDGDDWDKGISAIFSSSLNLNTLYKTEDMDDNSKDSSGTTLNVKNIWTICIFGSIFLIVTAFVFFAASILFVKRMVILMFLMMLSPLAFLGMILPATSGYSKQWWNMLFKESFYAPIFTMFIYVVAKGISTDEFKNALTGGTGASFSSVLTGDAGGGMSFVIFNFVLIIGLMLASIITASKLGATGASGMMSMGKNLNKWGQGKIKAGAGAATFGAGGRLARKTIGGTSQRAADAIASSNWAKKGGAGSKLALKTLRNVGDSSFDVRNTEMGKKMGAGTGIKGGYKTKRDKTKKDEIAYAKSLGLEGVELEEYGKKTDKTWKGRREVGQGVPRRIIGSIFSTIAKGAGTTQGQAQAGEALVKEYAQKTELKKAQDKLQKDTDLLTARAKLRKTKDWLKDAEKDGERLTDFRKDVYEAEDEVKKLETKIKEEIDVVKEKIKKAAEKAKAASKPKAT